MGLGHEVADALKVDPQHVLLLRHSNAKVAELGRRNIDVHANYTCVQPTNSRYDYSADGKPRIKVVVVIVNDKIDGVYWVGEEPEKGTTRSLVSPAFAEFDEEIGYKVKEAKRFKLNNAELRSIYGQHILGWSNPRCSVARYGGRLFDSVSLSEPGKAS